MRRAVAVIVTAGVVAASGCSGAQSPPRAQTVPRTPTSEPTADATSAAPLLPITEQQLQAVALTINDMPTGFHTDTALHPDSGGTNYLCNRPGRTKPAMKLFELFVKTNYGPFVGETLSSYSSTQSAQLAFDQTVAAGSACHSYTSDGSTTTLSAMSFPAMGQRTFALHDSDSEGVETDHVYVLQGRVLLHISVGGTVADPDLLSAMAHLAVKRVAARLPR